MRARVTSTVLIGFALLTQVLTGVSPTMAAAPAAPSARPALSAKGQTPTIEVVVIPTYRNNVPDAAALAKMEALVQEVAAFYTDQLSPDLAMRVKTVTAPVKVKCPLPPNSNGFADPILRAYRQVTPHGDGDKSVRYGKGQFQNGSRVVVMAKQGEFDWSSCSELSYASLYNTSPYSAYWPTSGGSVYTEALDGPVTLARLMARTFTGMPLDSASLCRETEDRSSQPLTLGGVCGDWRSECQWEHVIPLMSPVRDACRGSSGFSVLGTDRLANLTPYERLGLGLTRDTGIVDVAGSQTVRIGRTGAGSGLPTIASVPWRTSTPATAINKYADSYGTAAFSVEYLAAAGYSDWLDDRRAPGGWLIPGAGVAVRMIGQNSYGWTSLLDLHPERRNATSAYAPLMVQGESWTAPDGAVTIHVDSVMPDYVDVTVTRGDASAPKMEFFTDGYNTNLSTWRVHKAKKGSSRRLVEIDWNLAYITPPMRYDVVIDGSAKTVRPRIPATRTGFDYVDDETTLKVWMGPGKHTVTVTAVAADGTTATQTVAKTLR